jgi:hypothetical protein
MDELEKFQKLMEKIQKAKDGEKLDLSLEEDLSIAIMNLVSLEEHFFFTAEKTEKPEYLDLLNETRVIRKSLLSRMIDKHEGETWCISKHLLAATMRLMEVGTKYLSEGKQKDAKEVLNQAYKLYSLFWALRLKLIDTSEFKKIPEGKLNIHDKDKIEKPWKLGDIVKKLVNCCDE